MFRTSKAGYLGDTYNIGNPSVLLSTRKNRSVLRNAVGVKVTYGTIIKNLYIGDRGLG